jgi:hypothetical protein
VSDPKADRRERKHREGKQLGYLWTKDGGLILHEHGLKTLKTFGHPSEWQEFADHDIAVRYESAGDLHRRITATRIVLTGVFALAFKKKKDDRTAFVTVDVDGQPRWVQEIDPNKAGKALAFAKKAQQQAATG